ncbi:MAG: cytochrome c [Acidobacteriia bacterium]|nr:cytochrome c [Terriglobia bacterium]
MKSAGIALGIWLLFLGPALAQKEKEKSGGEAKKESSYAELAQAPEKARNRRNPLERDAEAPAAGRKLFERHCAECHGEDAAGSPKAPSLRAQAVQKAAPGALFWVLTNGVVRRGMPVWSKLPEAQRWQLVSYVQSLGTAANASPTSPPR